MEIYITHWWCCLKPTERAVFTAGAYAIGSGLNYITVEAWDILWLSAFGESALERAEIFKHSYGLTEGVIPCGEDCVKPVYFLNMAYWTEVYLFSLTDAFVCTAPCKVLAFSG